MKLHEFYKRLPSQFYAWGSLAPQPRNLATHLKVLDVVQAMTAPGMMEVLALGTFLLEPGECYLEIGTWHGATVLAAMRSTDTARGWAVDDASMTDHDHGDDPRERWHAHMATFGVAERATYVAGTWPLPLDIPPVGVFFFDGDKSTSDVALAGLEGAVSLLADRALIVLDDANTGQIRTAAHQFCKRHPEAWVFVDLPTPGNCFPTFWDGVICIGWERTV